MAAKQAATVPQARQMADSHRGPPSRAMAMLEGTAKKGAVYVLFRTQSAHQSALCVRPSLRCGWMTLGDWEAAWLLCGASQLRR